MSRCLWLLGDRNVAETVSSGRGRERPEPLHCCRSLREAQWQQGVDSRHQEKLPPSVFDEVRWRLRIQPVDATDWLNISAGVWKLRVFLGRSFNFLATALSLACE